MELVSLREKENLDNSIQEWLGFDKETPIVWIKYCIREGGKLELWTIETRPEYRRQGYSKKALAFLKKKYGVDEILHYGGYTPEGYAAIFPQVSWKQTSRDEPEASANFSSMNFVEEWDINYAY